MQYYFLCIQIYREGKVIQSLNIFKLKKKKKQNKMNTRRKAKDTGKLSHTIL